MKILFDQGTPVPLRQFLPDHVVITAYERGWQALQNGELLTAAETEGFGAIVTTDKNLRYQQNLAARQLAIVVLMTTDWRRIRPHTDRIAAAIATLTPNAYLELDIPPLTG